MASLSNHPTVQAIRAKNAVRPDSVAAPLDAEWLRTLCLKAGADDVGFVELERSELADQRADILAAFPHTKTLISIVCRMNRENIRSPARSVANVEFHHAGDEIEEVARKITDVLQQQGIRALYAVTGFPQEMSRFPGKIWVVSHKPVAVTAGLGRMGIHRNVIHPRFGNFILLNTILIDQEVTEYNRPIDYNPCLECKLCVAACPVGAISSDGHFNFSACYTHNYREFMGGFADWEQQLVESKDMADYRDKMTASESASHWQSLSFGANYKAAYCMAVCPAGEDVISPFLANRKTYLNEVVRPLQNKEEVVYVTPNSDAEAYVARRFPHKTTKRVKNGLSGNATSIRDFLIGMPLVFQRERSAGLNATYHFTFTGSEKLQKTIIIRNKTLQIQDGHAGKRDIAIIVDSQTWLNVLAQRQSIIVALMRRKLRIKGPARLLQSFSRCFV